MMSSVPDIPVWKKRKTLVKQLMALGLSRNDAEEEARWIKLGRKIEFSGIGYKPNWELFADYCVNDVLVTEALFEARIVDEWNSLGLN